MIGAPLVCAAFQFTTTEPFTGPGPPVTDVGPHGTPGVNGTAALYGPNPTALRARTLHVVATPFGRPVTSIGDPNPPLLTPPQVAWYAVIGLLPGSLGGANDTFAVPLADAPTFTSVGAPGADAVGGS